MKKRAFFWISLPLALSALLLQAGGFYFVFLAIGEAMGWFMLTMPPFMFVPQTPATQPTSQLGTIAGILLLSGIIMALLSLASVIASFRRHEGGWRFVTVIFLTVYVGSWLFVFYGMRN